MWFNHCGWPLLSHVWINVWFQRMSVELHTMEMISLCITAQLDRHALCMQLWHAMENCITRTHTHTYSLIHTKTVISEYTPHPVLLFCWSSREVLAGVDVQYRYVNSCVMLTFNYEKEELELCQCSKASFTLTYKTKWKRKRGQKVAYSVIMRLSGWLDTHFDGDILWTTKKAALKRSLFELLTQTTRKQTFTLGWLTNKPSETRSKLPWFCDWGISIYFNLLYNCIVSFVFSMSFIWIHLKRKSKASQCQSIKSNPTDPHCLFKTHKHNQRLIRPPCYNQPLVHSASLSSKT